MKGKVEDFLVVWWDHKKGCGMARRPNSPDTRDNWIAFRTRDLATLGQEDLRPGARIRARLEPAADNFRQHLREVEIYEEPPEQELDFTARMAVPGMKIYRPSSSN